MNLSGLLPLLDQLPAFRQLLADLSDGGVSRAKPQAIINAVHPFLISGIATRTQPSAVVILAARSEVAYELARQFTAGQGRA